MEAARLGWQPPARISKPMLEDAPDPAAPHGSNGNLPASNQGRFCNGTHEYSKPMCTQEEPVGVCRASETARAVRWGDRAQAWPEHRERSAYQFASPSVNGADAWT